MFNDGSGSNNHHHHHHHFSVVEKSFRIKQDDKFFSRVMSKETSLGNTSSRVFYYGESSVAVPFVWEAQPGTPKHPLSETSLLPPLTPPPSYFTNSKSNHKRRTNSSSSKLGNSSSSHMFSCILPRRKTHMSPSSSLSSSSSTSTSSSSSSSSSWSLVYPSNSSCSIRDRDNSNNNHGSLSFSQLRTEDVGTTFSKHKGSSNGFVRGCYPFGSMKKKNNAILSHETV